MKYEYPWMSEVLRSRFALKKPPVAISLLPDLEVRIPVLKEPMRFCEMWVKAMEGEIVCATEKENTCGGGTFYMGLAKPSPDQRNGTFLSRTINLYRTPRAAVRTDEDTAKIPRGVAVATICAPLDKAGWDVDVVLIVCDPAQAMKIMEAVTYDTGGYVSGRTGPATCSVAVAQPYLSGDVTYCVADVGARDFMKLEDNEMIVSIPGEKLPGIVNNILEREGAFKI
ncbi:hypothetical protein CUJ83_11335 [Methanocella sp. CWC-04]|uniref:DUF169 domain-containing protein n=1 Tax=Methanooceanicella nereidis TaxID=2052831 RepID=A0AAP2RDG3_9EURY|nr:DUF169 domain-containing protein [Methanocella sp. CWC-04]MCD1295591.1 hypothetical protein [Methanocella sp. CWC-04]